MSWRSCLRCGLPLVFLAAIAGCGPRWANQLNRRGDLSGAQNNLILASQAPIFLSGYVELLQTKEEYPAPPIDARFQPPPLRLHGYGITDDFFWLRFRIQNDSPTSIALMLEIPHRIFDSIRVFSVNERGEISRLATTGAALPFDQRPVRHRNFLIPLQLPAAASETIYLELRSPETVALPLVLHTAQSLIERDNFDFLWLGAYYGALALMLLLNLIVYLAVRDESYIWYILYLCLLGMLQFALDGFAFQYLWPAYPGLAELSGKFIACLATAAGMMFAARFLQLKERHPILDRTLRYGALLPLALAVVVNFTSAAVGARLVNQLSPLATLLILAAAIVSVAHGFGPARLFLAAWLALIANVLFITLRNLGLFADSRATLSGLHLGSMIEMALLSFALGVRLNRLRQEKETAQRQEIESRLQMLDRFARFTPREFLERLQRESPVDIRAGDAVREDLAVLFCDLRGFTSVSEKLKPDEVFRLINGFLSEMEPAIRQHGGFVDKFIGDAIMALFPGGAADALRAARAMWIALDQRNQRAAQMNEPELRMGVGIHCGEVTLGVVGNDRRMNATALGDTVNVAARLESLSKRYSTRTLLSENAVAALIELELKQSCREIDRVQLKGRSAALRIFEDLGADKPEARAARLSRANAFDQGIQLYRSGNFQQAQALFEECLLSGQDAVALLYTKRCALLLRKPPQHWSGISSGRI